MAASAPAFTNGWALKTAPRFPKSLRAPLAAGIQRAVEQTVVRIAGSGARQLCFAGGLGLNALLVSALECLIRERFRTACGG